MIRTYLVYMTRTEMIDRLRKGLRAKHIIPAVLSATSTMLYEVSEYIVVYEEEE